jgi:hypothetical protein
MSFVLAEHTPQRPHAFASMVQRFLDHAELLDPLQPLAQTAPLLIGLRTRDGYDWHLLCLRCGFCSLPFTEKPTRPICQICSDRLEGRRNLAALNRAIAGASRADDVVIEG